jgi:hypothetical protein
LAQYQRRSDPVILDFDASLVDVHSELKERAAANYKGGIIYFAYGKTR